MAPNLGDGDWRSLAEKTSKEMDPAKLMIFVAQLCRALDERGKGPRLYRHQENQTTAFQDAS
jgi:hypothetical protein